MPWNRTIPAAIAATGGLGVFNVSPPIAQPAAYTVTGAARRVETAQTSAAISTTAATNVTPNGYSTAAQANAIPAAINQLTADVGVLYGVLRQVITDLQAYGLLQ